MEFTASQLVLKLFNFVGAPLLGVGVAVSGNGKAISCLCKKKNILDY